MFSQPKISLDITIFTYLIAYIKIIAILEMRDQMYDAYII